LLLMKNNVSEYNRDQLISFQAISKVLEQLSPTETGRLEEMIQPYLAFRRRVDMYAAEYFQAFCGRACFETGLSACCGFESIITFFADQVITVLTSQTKDLVTLFETLRKPNDTGKCVYLGPKGCIWRVRPVSCAMFFCQDAKENVFRANPEAESLWKMLIEEERGYTWPTTTVLFDEVEKYFLRFGVESPHLYFHKSPGLLKLKSESGVA